MDRQEAIKVLKRDLAIQKENKCLPDGIEAIEMAITALQISIENDGVQKVLNDIFCNDNGLNPPEPTVPVSCSEKPNECEDAISRQAAIDAVCRWGTKNEQNKKFMITMAEVKQSVANILDNLPQINPRNSQYYNGGWIPVSERLPKKDGFYLATCDGEICGEDKPFTGLAEFENGKWVDDDEDYQCVLAWQDIPQPYKEDVE